MTLHYLVPPFILQNFTQNCLAGDFEAVCLFVDTSGFTPLMTALMAYGTEGAEAIADTLVTIFSPLVRMVYEQGGFVVGFAGDAFKAVFPTKDANAYQRAIVTAWQIRQYVAEQSIIKTRFGEFDFAVKVCVADGHVSWGILESNVRQAAQRATYYFEGEGLARCLDADPYAKAGEIVITRALAERLMSREVRVEPITATYWRLSHVADRFCARYPKQAANDEVFHEKQATAFFPAELLELPVQGEFRQVVSMFINLQELPQGEEKAHFQQTLFRLLAQYGGYLCRMGRIGDRDKGGTLLLFWGAPTSYENDIARSLKFILELQKEISIPLRAGITSRMAYAGFIGSDFCEEYTCYGSYVNLAARLMVSAEWNEIWLDDEMARLAGTQFEVGLKGRYLFKGFLKEWPVFRLIRQSEGIQTPSYHTQMIGRKHEFNQLRAAIQPIFTGEPASCGLISVLGEAGIGKSRLIYDVKRELEETHTHFQWHLCQPDNVHREWQSLHPFRRFLHHYFDLSFVQSATEEEQAQQDEERKQLFTQKLTTLIASTPCSILQQELLRTRSFLGALLDLHWQDSSYSQAEETTRLTNTFAALNALFKAESLRSPLILHIEDGHWLDSNSIRFIEQLREEINAYPIAIIMSIRAQQASERLKKKIYGHSDAQSITLSPLSTNELCQLASELLQAQPSEPLVELLTTRADGNPFFAEQILLYLQEQEMLEVGTLRDERVKDSPFLQEAPMTPEVRAILIPKLDRLSPEIKEVVQMASVLGRQFEVKVLREMVQNDSNLTQKMDLAAQAAIWSPRYRTTPHRAINVGHKRAAKNLNSSNYKFKHEFLQKTAYEMQLGARRRQLHQQAAEAMETVYATDLDPHYHQLAYHYEQAGILSKTRLYLSKAKTSLSKYMGIYMTHSSSVSNPN